MDTQEIGTLCACVREAGQIIGVPAVTCASVPERREEGKSTHQQIDRGAARARRLRTVRTARHALAFSDLGIHYYRTDIYFRSFVSVAFEFGTIGDFCLGSNG